MDIETVLSTSEFFRGLSDANREALARICIPRNLTKRQTLFVEGEQGQALYICIHGSIQLHKSTPDGRDVVIRVIGPGEVFAEVVLLEKDRYPVTATALTKALVFAMARSQFHALLSEAEFRNDFIAMLMAKQRYLADQIKYLSLHDVGERLIAFLRDHFGPREVMTCPLSKKDVAAAIGVTPETLSRTLLKLKAAKRLVWEGKEIRMDVSPATAAPRRDGNGGKRR
jgi:CRP/FNR family transcriptional regulator